jgi:hypothetical protein
MGAPPPVPLDEVRISRHPTIVAPSRVAAREPFDVRVSLTRTPSPETLPGQQDALDLRMPGAGPWTLRVVISAPGCRIVDGAGGRTITLAADADSTEATFRLVAGRKPGPRTVFATFWHRGRYLGKAEGDLAVDAPGEAPRADPSPRPTTAVAAGMAFEPNAPAPDLTLWLLAGRNPERPEVEVMVHSPHLFPLRGTAALDPRFADWLESRYRRLAPAAARGVAPAPGSGPPDREATIATARALGRELHDRFLPDIVRRALTQLHATLGRPPTVQVFTNDPRFPWELLSYRDPAGAWRDFLGIQTSVARWHVVEGDRVMSRPPASLPIASFVSVVPRYADAPLPAGEQDLAGLSPGIRERVRVVRGTREAFRTLVADASSTISVIHFAGHGEVRATPGSPPEFVLRLEDGSIAASDWAGLLPETRRPDHPLVFLNACGLGAEARVAGTVEGWASTVLEGGASGYVGGLWPLGDGTAARFAQRFYETAFAGEPVAIALSRARREFLESGDPTYLAYVFYGDVYLRFHPL